jgi:hypothetical protein
LNNDDITNDTTRRSPARRGVGRDGELFDTNGTTVLGTGVSDGSGNWTITSSASLKVRTP